MGVRLGAGDRQRVVLQDFSFEVGAGEFVSIVGRSGVGKTTLLRLLAGLVEPDPDSVVKFWGRPVNGPPQRASVVFQDSSRALLPWRSVARNVALPLEGHLPRDERDARVARSLEVVGLAAHADKRPSALSGGMQQRVQIARALVTDPHALLMDEPFGSLDALTTEVLEDELLRVHAQAGCSVVFVTHDIDQAVYLSDRVVVLEGSPATIVLDVDIPCPRPRSQVTTRSSPAFLKARLIVHDRLMGDGSEP